MIGAAARSRVISLTAHAHTRTAATAFRRRIMTRPHQLERVSWAVITWRSASSSGRPGGSDFPDEVRHVLLIRRRNRLHQLVEGAKVLDLLPHRKGGIRHVMFSLELQDNRV